MSNLSAVLLGIASSLIATAIFLGLAELLRRVVLPWYADKIYRGVRIDGRWGADTGTGTYVLTQKGDHVTGSYFHTLELKGGAKKREEYRVAGTLRDTYATLILRPIAKDMIDSMASVYRLLHDDQSRLCMRGKSVYISTDTAEVKTSDAVFVKETS